MSCCPATAEPPRATAPHSGMTISIDGMKVYRTGPPTAKVGVLALPDMAGPDSGRSKQDADRLGELGYVVTLLDLADGDYKPTNPLEIVDYLKKYDYDTILVPRILKTIEYLKAEAQVEAIVSYGYCWGSWVGARLSATPDPLYRGHVSFHPSWFAENLLHGDGGIEKVARLVQVPQLVLAARDDPDSLKEGDSVDKILRGLPPQVSTLSNVVDFPDCNHGWVNRGDLEDPAIRQGVDRAWELARKFFEAVTA